MFGLFPPMKAGINTVFGQEEDLLMFKKIDCAVEALVTFMAYCSSALTVFLVSLVVADVFGRAVFHKAILGTPIFARNALIAMIFLALPWVTKQTKHIRSELIVERSRGLWRQLLDLMAYLIGIAVFAGFSIALVRPMRAAIRLGEMDVEGTAFIPLAPFFIICVLGSLLSCYCSIKVFVKTIKNPYTGSILLPEKSENSKE